MVVELKLKSGLTGGTTQEEYEVYRSALLHDAKLDESFVLIQSWHNLLEVLEEVDFSKVKEQWQDRAFDKDVSFNMTLIKRHIFITPEDGQSEAMKNIRLVMAPGARSTFFESIGSEGMRYSNILRNLEYFPFKEKLREFPVQPIVADLVTLIGESEVLRSYVSDEFKDFVEYIRDCGTDELINNIPERSLW